MKPKEKDVESLESREDGAVVDPEKKGGVETVRSAGTIEV